MAPFERWKSLEELFAAVEPEMLEKAVREDMWDVNELTLEGSPPMLLPEEALVLSAKG